MESEIRITSKSLNFNIIDNFLIVKEMQVMVLIISFTNHHNIHNGMDKIKCHSGISIPFSTSLVYCTHYLHLGRLPTAQRTAHASTPAAAGWKTRRNDHNRTTMEAAAHIPTVQTDTGKVSTNVKINFGPKAESTKLYSSIAHSTSTHSVPVAQITRRVGR